MRVAPYTNVLLYPPPPPLFSKVALFISSAETKSEPREPEEKSSQRVEILWVSRLLLLMLQCLTHNKRISVWSVSEGFSSTAVTCIYRRRFTSTCWTSPRRERCGSSQRPLRRSTRRSMFWYECQRDSIIPHYIKEKSSIECRTDEDISSPLISSPTLISLRSIMPDVWWTRGKWTLTDWRTILRPILLVRHNRNVLMFLKVSYTHQGCIYFIKKMYNVLLWNIIII